MFSEHVSATARRIAAVAAFLTAGVVVATAGAPAGAAPGVAAQLTRYPYLTDLVGTSVIVNWATDKSFTTGSATWGAVGSGGTCTPTTKVTAVRTSITVASVPEYQWAARLSLPASGRY